uniref:Uncharacterized protein n=1 Tax=Anopheles atroparvus TaxID=41427 RepID=A0A182JD81_ANOAO
MAKNKDMNSTAKLAEPTVRCGAAVVKPRGLDQQASEKKRNKRTSGEVMDQQLQQKPADGCRGAGEKQIPDDGKFGDGKRMVEERLLLVGGTGRDALILVVLIEQARLEERTDEEGEQLADERLVEEIVQQVKLEEGLIGDAQVVPLGGHGGNGGLFVELGLCQQERGDVRIVATAEQVAKLVVFNRGLVAMFGRYFQIQLAREDGIVREGALVADFLGRVDLREVAHGGQVGNDERLVGGHKYDRQQAEGGDEVVLEPPAVRSRWPPQDAHDQLDADLDRVQAAQEVSELGECQRHRDDHGKQPDPGVGVERVDQHRNDGFRFAAWHKCDHESAPEGHDLARP